MSEKDSRFTWRPLYAELVKKLPEYNPKELIELAQVIGIDQALRDQFPKGAWVELEDFDPFSFLSLLNKYGNEKRISYLNDLLSLLGSDVPPASDVDGLPTSNAQMVWWFGYKYKRKSEDIPNLWKLYSQVINDSIEEEQFSRALNTYGIANAKLTEGLFYVNPEKYLPINSQTIPYLKDRGISSIFNTYEEYLEILQKLKGVSDKPFYEISHDAFIENIQRKADTQSSKAEPKGNYWVFQGNPSQYQIVEALQANSIKTWRVSAHKNKISIGDKVILWVTGEQSGCYALAEVASNIFTAKDDETEQYFQTDQSNLDPLERVQIKILSNLWDNPVRKNQIEDLPEFRSFKGGNQGTTFSSSREEYELIEQMIGRSEVSEKVVHYTSNSTHPKNIILYGPPGTGKTYTTIDRAVEITDGQKSEDHKTNKKRFDALLGKQIEFITFHQNYTYEDFVTGIKPALNESEGGLRFGRHEGIFYKIAQRARKNHESSKEPSKNYVLIIDEINRANMSRVFGELITLLEDDKRLGAENELQVVLPSGELFAVSPNLYLIGTMNTADKSLALLDIALRRRFEFEGMYPKYDIPDMDPETAVILQKLNKAIYDTKKSADFLIGHAYFLNKKKGELKDTFEKRVIPLLMEYFSGRTELVGKVLQEAGIKTKLCELTYQLRVDDDTL